MTTELQMEAPPAYYATPATTSSTEAPFKSIWEDQPAAQKVTVPRSNSSSEPVNRCLIIFALLCCTLFGRMASYYNTQAVLLYKNRSVQAGDEAAHKAKVCSISAIVVGTIVLFAAIGGLTAWLVLRFL